MWLWLVACSSTISIPRGPKYDTSPDSSTDEVVPISEMTLTFDEPIGEADNPVTFRVEASPEVVRVVYRAEDTWDLGDSTDGGAGFPVTYTFSETGERTIVAIGYDADDVELVRAETAITVHPAAPEPGDGNHIGAWLWTIEGTGMSHAALADTLVDMGLDRIYVKVADGSASCGSWPELCDSSLVQTYHDRGLEVYAWSYNYPGNDTAQADALYEAAVTGYDGYVLDLEIEFDGLSGSLESLLAAFDDARSDAMTSGYADQMPLLATTWGNPMDHNFRIDIVDRYVDAHLPQTYVEVWGSSYMADLEYWIEVGDCEYRALGATKPVHHIISTEYNDITASEIQRFVAASGPETSVWRIPGDGTPLSIWDDWGAVDWDSDVFSTYSCP